MTASLWACSSRQSRNSSLLGASDLYGWLSERFPPDTCRDCPGGGLGAPCLTDRLRLIWRCCRAPVGRPPLRARPPHPARRGPTPRCARTAQTLHRCLTQLGRSAACERRVGPTLAERVRPARGAEMAKTAVVRTWRTRTAGRELPNARREAAGLRGSAEGATAQARQLQRAYSASGGSRSWRGGRRGPAAPGPPAALLVSAPEGADPAASSGLRAEPGGPDCRAGRGLGTVPRQGRSGQPRVAGCARRQRPLQARLPTSPQTLGQSRSGRLARPC